MGDGSESVRDASHGLAPLVEQQEAHHPAALQYMRRRESRRREAEAGPKPWVTCQRVRGLVLMVLRIKHVLTVHRREILDMSQPHTRVRYSGINSRRRCLIVSGSKENVGL